MIFESLSLRAILASLCLGLIFLASPLRRKLRTKKYTRGKRKSHRNSGIYSRTQDGPLLAFGNQDLPSSFLTNHFLFAGTSGGAKTLLQRRLLHQMLCSIRSGTDSRCLILDTKNDAVPFLRKIGVTCQVYSLNPFESRDELPRAVAWDVAADITTPSEALNFSSGIFPEEKDGTNRFWTDAARMVVAAVMESLIRHSPEEWSFSDFVFITLSLERITSVLSRDEHGLETLRNFFRDKDVTYKIFTTIASRMSYYKPVAALWSRLPKDRKLSVRSWLAGESILLLGVNATSRRALDVINELIFRTVVQEVDMQKNSSSRQTVLWIDEARLAGPLLRRELLPYWTIKARSKGGAVVISFQDIEGFRDACGSALVANEIVAQCSYKVLGRLESEESAKWASGLCGQHETIEWFHSEFGRVVTTSHSRSEQRVQKSEVLPAEFYNIPIPSKSRGATAVFLSPGYGWMETVKGSGLESVAVSEVEEQEHGFQSRKKEDQWLRAWSGEDRKRLLIHPEGSEKQ